MPDGFYLAVTVFVGLCFGSFATALSWRLPRNLPMAGSRSKCPSCGRTLGVADLVPVFSWLLLRGKCRGCGAPIGWRYPLIELMTMLLCLAFYLRFGFSPSTLVLFCLAPVIMALADIDLAFKILPDGLNLAVLLLGLAALVANAFTATDPPGFILEQLPGALGGMAVYGLLAAGLRLLVMMILKKDPLGWGDIKFYAAAGFWMGTDALKVAHFMLVSGIAGIVLALLWRKIRGEREFPYGPALLTAFVAILLLEPPVFIFQ